MFMGFLCSVIEIYYLSYESNEGNLKNVKLDICPKKPMDMCFYEEDIDCDGDKELLVSCTHSTGIGARMDSLDVIDFKSSSAESVFDVQNHTVTFTDEQRTMISSVISLWNDRGFAEKTGIILEKDFKTELFVPSIVKSNNNVMIKVDFNTSQMISEQSLRGAYISALFSFNDNEPQLENMWIN